MKYLFTSFALCIALGSLLTAPVIAQTPDGQTPAEETVCDPIKADGVTKGLYGLCVAFCEAQDQADAGTPITEGDLELLEGNAPSGRILANYNKRKQETDPAMPCIMVEEPCPCWTQAELEAIDGVGTNGFNFQCNRTVPDTVGFIFGQQIQEGIPFAIATAFSDSERTPPIFRDLCQYTNRQITPTVFRSLSLSPEEASSCLAAVKERCDLFGL